MRVYLVVIGSTLTWLANAEYKYYCKFFEELLAQCIGRPTGGPGVLSYLVIERIETGRDASFDVRDGRSSRSEWRMVHTLKNLTALDTFDEIMRLETSPDQYDDDTPIRAEAFIFEYSWLGESHKAIMVTFEGESAILFDTSMRPLRSAEYKYFSSERYPNRYSEAQRQEESLDAQVWIDKGQMADLF
ncbi:hypothetical protein FOZ61_008938 [Perkinsus olseni]|uniref:Uncharacterized protein n=1 Tax=Perkinsus olseni TaxID=32597 RepID=A0A7J6L2U3_PEROL|nr:hypothetical protein FOZ61_008938 [Perkinsus olseni]KAF4665582.1 hypothetical protein FOL46_003572 [Perkinsus olseni]